MPDLLSSYLRYARGESPSFFPWGVLNLFGKIFHPFMCLRNAFYDRGIFRSMDPPVPVISVGNLCHGGTNKTPMVEMIARKLMGLGLSVGIVSRGYGGATRKPLWVGQDEWSSSRMATGDEPLMLANRLPKAMVVVSRDRYEGVQMLHDLGAEVVVADDAFQHRRMGRDLDIVLIDATCPFGNGRLFPAGILREWKESLSRAGLVILTKVEQAGPEAVAGIKSELGRWVPFDRVFTARIGLDSWMVMERGVLRRYETERGALAPRGGMLAFSAIGHPDSFHRSLETFGVEILESRAYRDHHSFARRDIDELERRASELGASGLVCTEKDLHNMPEDPSTALPLYIPRITVSMDDEERFWSAFAGALRPKLVVASNGYGEDAMGALLAHRLRLRFEKAKISAFTLVGSGKAYRERGLDVLSPPSELPSGGIVKYSLRALLRDIRHGLRKDIEKQIVAWRLLIGRSRAPICVGDVYLMAHTLWGQGLSPLLLATAKSVRLRGHGFYERSLMRRRAVRVWTRDAETAEDLKKYRVDAVFHGNPIMDLALDTSDGDDDPWKEEVRPRIMLLPGSRPRAYGDVIMLLEAVKRLDERRDCSYLMVLAPTIDREMLLGGVPYSCDEEGRIRVGGARVSFYSGPIAVAAKRSNVLIGLGGTANQVSAGLGVPIVSIIERGKLVQKKLLGGSEILVPPTAEALADAVFNLLNDPPRMNEMARIGIDRMGGPGAIDAVIEYAAKEMGWEARHGLFEILSSAWMTDTEETASNVGYNDRDEKPEEAWPG